jgi:hypothetical protein
MRPKKVERYIVADVPGIPSVRAAGGIVRPTPRSIKEGRRQVAEFRNAGITAVLHRGAPQGMIPAATIQEHRMRDAAAERKARLMETPEGQ